LRGRFTDISAEIEGVNINEGDGQLLGVAEAARS